MQTVAEAIADELVSAGVDRVFGLPGGEVLHLLDALRRRGIEFVLCRHEADAGLTAAVYGKLKGTVGVVLTTLGPGAANLMLPLSNSRLDREPLLAIAAEIPSSRPASHTHQRLPLQEIYQPIVKWSASVSGFNAGMAVREAIAASLTEPQGPTLLTVSTEVSASPCYLSGPESGDGATTAAYRPVVEDATRIAGILQQRLAAAKSPFVLLGLGAPPRLTSKLRQWLSEWNLPVAVTPKVKGIVDETAPNFVGVVGGMAIDNLMIDALQQADLLIGFGFDPVEVDKPWHAELPIVWVLESPQAMEVVPASGLLVADLEVLLTRLLDLTPPSRDFAPFAGIQARRRAMFLDDLENSASSAEGVLAPMAIVRTLSEVFPAETIVCTDVGSHKYLFGQFWPSREPQTFFVSNGLSGMGYGLPAAIAAKLACPHVPVLAVLGDGGFSMNSQELETARRLAVELIVIVLADRSYSLIRHSQQNKRLPRYGVDFSPIDTVRTAQACGYDAVAVSSMKELAICIQRAVVARRGLVVEVPVDADAWRGLV